MLHLADSKSLKRARKCLDEAAVAIRRREGEREMDYSSTGNDMAWDTICSFLALYICE